MAIAFGAETQGTVSGASSLTFTSPTVSGSNTFGVVTVFVQTNLTINTVTWNGAACTFINGKTNAGADERIEMWYIMNPSLGATNIVVSRTGSTNSLNGYAMYYTGVKQTGQPDASTNNINASTSTFTQSVTTVADNCWTICNARNGLGNFSASTNTTFRSTASSVIFADSNGVVTPAGSFSMSSTFAGPGEAYGQMISISPADTTISFDAFTQSSTTASSLTYAHTVTGSNPTLALFIIGNTSGGGDTITGATYAGVSMTQLDKQAPSGDTDRWTYSYVLQAPATGSNNIVISSSSSSFIQGNSLSYAGTKQSGGVDNHTSATGTASTTQAVSLTTVANNCWLVGFEFNNVTAGVGTVKRSSATNPLSADSNGAKPTAGSYSLNYTAASQTWTNFLLSLAPFVSSSSPRRTLMGAGI